MPPTSSATTGSPLEVRLVPLDAPQPAAYNPRQMPEAEMAALKASLSEFGFVDPILVRRGDMLVIGGHQRLEAAKQLGMEAVPVIELDLTDEQARALNVALNRIGGEWDIPKLNELLASLPGDLARLTGFDESAMKRIAHEAEAAMRALAEGDGDLDQVPEPPEEATTQPGDLWILGRHRLLCGDSGSPSDLDRLLHGAEIHLVNMDPPYNVKVEPRSNNAIAAGLPPRRCLTRSGVASHAPA